MVLVLVGDIVVGALAAAALALALTFLVIHAWNVTHRDR